MEGRNREFLNLILEYDGLRNNIQDVLETIPEFKQMKGFNQQNPHHVHDLLYHTVFTVEGINKDKPIYLKLSALFHDYGKLFTQTVDNSGIAHYFGHPKVSAEKTKKLLLEFGYDEITTTKAVTLIEHHERQWNENPTRKQVKKFISKLNEGNVTFEEYYILRMADISAQNPTTIPDKLKIMSKLLNIYESIELENMDQIKKLEKMEELGIVDVTKETLDINGSDIKRDSLLKNLKGKEIGEAINEALMFAKKNKGLNNKKEFILGHLYKWYSGLNNK